MRHTTSSTGGTHSKYVYGSMLFVPNRVDVNVVVNVAAFIAGFIIGCD